MTEWWLYDLPDGRQASIVTRTDGSAPVLRFRESSGDVWHLPVFPIGGYPMREETLADIHGSRP